MASLAQASPFYIHIGPMPILQRTPPALLRALGAQRIAVERDARECMEKAQGMDVSGLYETTFKKEIETPKAITILLTRSMMCDGVHTSSYRYSITLDMSSGRSINLKDIYKIATQQGDRIFLRAELVNFAEESYRQENKSNGSCLDLSGWQSGIKNFPISFSPQPDGSIALYYSTPDVSAGCFPTLKISRRVVAPYRDAKRASEYDLP